MGMHVAVRESSSAAVQQLPLAGDLGHLAEAAPAAAQDQDQKQAQKKAEDAALAANWVTIQKVLRTDLGEDIFASWFRSMKFEGADGSCAIFSVPTRFLKSWISTHYRDKIVEMWQAMVPHIKTIDLRVRTIAKVQPRPAAAAPVNRVALQRAFAAKGPANDLQTSPLDPLNVFDNYVVGQSNALAHGAARNVLAAVDMAIPTFNPLLIHGGVGVGKTHLLQSIAHAFGPRAAYVTCEKFKFGFLSSLRAIAGSDFKTALSPIDVLLIDDIQFLRAKADANDLAMILNALVDGRRQVVLAADRPPSDLTDFDERLRSRMNGGLVVQIHAPDDAMRRGILDKRRHELDPNLRVDPAIMDHLAQNLVSNGRDLEGALNQLWATSKITGEPISMRGAQIYVQNALVGRPPQRAKIEDIQRLVANYYNVSRQDLISARRTANVVKPRQIAMYLAKILTLRSLPEIGRRFGGRDHTTVLHAVRKIEGLVGSDAALAEEVEKLKRQLQEL